MWAGAATASAAAHNIDIWSTLIIANRPDDLYNYTVSNYCNFIVTTQEIEKQSIKGIVALLPQKNYRKKMGIELKIARNGLISDNNCLNG